MPNPGWGQLSMLHLNISLAMTRLHSSGCKRQRRVSAVSALADADCTPSKGKSIMVSAVKGQSSWHTGHRQPTSMLSATARHEHGDLPVLQLLPVAGCFLRGCPASCRACGCSFGLAGIGVATPHLQPAHAPCMGFECCLSTALRTPFKIQATHIGCCSLSAELMQLGDAQSGGMHKLCTA